MIPSIERPYSLSVVRKIHIRFQPRIGLITSVKLVYLVLLLFSIRHLDHDDGASILEQERP